MTDRRSDEDAVLKKWKEEEKEEAVWSIYPAVVFGKAIVCAYVDPDAWKGKCVARDTRDFQRRDEMGHNQLQVRVNG